ncbi:hypothetical protein EYZ11_002273 [Aspergillus tanneri]|uniref:Uncharacterized protein n=1 Tax=Aspergillus tanneri TaxID=1220188 RepID=A0A4S3JU49_9EURO|nr:hypothetical protein EYZ11_002273 [Aspergillus tanneri]
MPKSDKPRPNTTCWMHVGVSAISVPQEYLIHIIWLGQYTPTPVMQITDLAWLWQVGVSELQETKSGINY